MAWTTPRTWVDGEIETAAIFNTHVRDNLLYLFDKVKAARVYNNAAISTSSGVNTALTFNTERFDTGNFHSTSVNTGRLTAPSAGVYLIGGLIAFAANVTGVRYAQLRVNGTTYIGLQSALALTGGNLSAVPVMAAYELAAGDYVELVSFQDSGGNLNVNSTGNYTPEFWIIGPIS